MLFSYSLTILGFCSILMACSSGEVDGTGPTKTNDIEIEEEPTDSGNSNGGGSQAVDAADLTQTQTYERGELTVSLEGSRATADIRGTQVNFEKEDELAQSIIFQKVDYGSWDYYGAGFVGRAVEGSAFSWYSYRDASSSSGFRLDGQLTNADQIPSSLYAYDGVFIVTRPWLAQDGRIVVSEMRWIADFSTGEFSGHDHPEQSVVFFEGEIEGNLVSGHVAYQLGRDEFEAAFFGPNAAEFAGGFRNGGVSVIFYGEHNEFISDQLH